MEDQMISGAIAGTAGAVIQNVYSFLLRLWGLSDRGYIDFGRAVIFFQVKDGKLMSFLGLIAHITLDILLGILFAYIIKNSTSRYYYFKAIIFSLASWFFLHTAGTALRLPEFFNISSHAALTTLIGAFIYGLSSAYILRILKT
jgi:uncharacterized membrane protein YagU involved in acid resistance